MKIFRKFFSILIGKLIVLVGVFFKRGSSKPGQVALKIYKDFFSSIKLPKTVIAVTGSSGKGSISTMVAHTYRSLGYKVAHNSKGSNLSAGIATLLLENCSLTGKIKSDVLVYEVDERYAKYIFGDITPNYVVISNICRDQPPRQGSVDLVYQEIKKALNKDMRLVLNADDPYLQKFVLDGFNASFFGIGKNDYSYTKNPFNSLNMVYCPKCNNKLKYDYYHFEALGKYSCEKCDFKTPNIDFEVTNLDYDNNTITINNEYDIKLSFGILYNIYNTLAAFAITSLVGLDQKLITESLNTFETNTKLNNKYSYKNRKVVVLSNKAENSTTFNQSILYTKRFEGKKTILIGWKEISRRYKFNDVSWLYDIDFEILNDDTYGRWVCMKLPR